jgi:DNA repair exonuclease SbcCD ATPase subunit
MYIKAVELENWLAYKGVQRVELEAQTYAVVAKVEGQDGRSNWSGKTAFIEAIAFALYGIHRKRSEDEWIFETAKRGSVMVEFSNGVVVLRYRERGQATKLEVQDGDNVLGGSEAQSAIESIVGMGKDDFLTTCYFRQKDVARIVYATPSERAKHFAQWFRLSALQKAEAEALERMRNVLDCVESDKAIIDNCVERVTALVGYDGLKTDSLAVVRQCVEQLKKRRDRAESVEQKWKKEFERLDEVYQQDISARNELERSVERAKKYADDSKRLEELRADEPEDCRSEVDALNSKAGKVGAEAEAASQKYESAKRLVCGEFDGLCPVNGSACPVAADVAADVAAAECNAAECKASSDALSARYSELVSEVSEAKKKQRRRDSYLKRVAALEAKLDELASDYDRSMALIGKELEEVDSDARGHAMQMYSHAKAASIELNKHVAALCVDSDVVEEVGEALSNIKVASEEVALLRTAAHIFGKQGAQRAISESVLAAIVADGNDKLKLAGIDLSFNITWAREGKSLADTCSQCGRAFPSSQRVKACKCGEKRGPKLIEKSDILFSDRSGAAEDIIGGIIRLEAGKWFKADRGSNWSTLLVDEPFGALDDSNRDAFARLLKLACTPINGAAQAFIVAHNNDVMDDLPATILVRRYDGHSTIEVVGA